MKRGVFVLAGLALLFVISGTASAQVRSKSVTTVLIDNFDSIGDQNYQIWERGNLETLNWEWKAQASRFVEDGYPLVQTFEGLPNTLRVFQTGDATPTVLGVKSKFRRKGDNWFEVFPANDDKPYEIPLSGNVGTIDFWVWGANYRYYLDVLVRDADGVVHILPAGNLAFNGWKNVIVKIPGRLIQRSKKRSGPTKMTFVGFRITTDTAEFVDDFQVFFDELRYTSDAVVDVFDGYEMKDYVFDEEPQEGQEQQGEQEESEQQQTEEESAEDQEGGE